MGKYLELLKKARLGIDASGLTVAADKQDDPILRRAVQRHLNRRSVFDPNYGEIPENIKEVALPKDYELDKDVNDSTLTGASLGAGLGMIPTVLGGNLYVSPILAGAALGGYGFNKLIKSQQEDYRNLSEKEKQESLKNYLKNYKAKQEKGEVTEADLDQAKGLAAVGGLASSLANPIASKVMMSSVKKIDPLKDNQLSEIINSAGLKGKLDVEKPKKHENDFNAYFKAYEGEELKKKKGKIGLIKAMSKDTWKPGVMAHEVGHADIHNAKAHDIAGLMQRSAYRPTMMANQLGLGIVPVMATNKLVGKEEDNPLVGGLKGGLVGSAANAGILIPEFEASRRGLKHMMNSKSLKGKVMPNALSTVPAFLTYLSFLAGPSAAAGAIKAYLNKKRKEKEKTAADEDQGLDAPALAAGAVGFASPYAGLYNAPDTWHGGKGDQAASLQAFKNKLRAGDVLLSGDKHVSPAQMLISLTDGNPQGYHVGIVEKNRKFHTLDSGHRYGYYDNQQPDKVWRNQNLQILRPKSKSHGKEMVRQGRRLADSSGNFRWLVEDKLRKKGYSKREVTRLSEIITDKLYNFDQGLKAGTKNLLFPKIKRFKNTSGNNKSYEGNMQFIKEYADPDSRRANKGSQKIVDLVDNLVKEEKLKQQNDSWWQKLKNDAYASKGQPGKIYRDAIAEAPGVLNALGLHPDVMSTAKFNEIRKCLPIGAGGVCSTVPAVLGKKQILKNKANADITPADYLRSDQFEPVATYRGGKRSDLKGKIFQDYLLPNAPHLMRAGIGAGMGTLGYLGLKGARALKDSVVARMNGKSDEPSIV